VTPAAVGPPPLPTELTSLVPDLRREFAKLADHAIDPQGQLRPAPEGTIPDTWTPLDNRDPVRWNSIVEQLPSVRGARRWLESLPVPDDLTPRARRVLTTAAAVLEEHGLPDPFAAFEGLVPEPGSIADPLPATGRKWARQNPVPESVTGWRAVAHRALAELNTESVDLEEDYEGVVRRERPRTSSPFRSYRGPLVSGGYRDLLLLMASNQRYREDTARWCGKASVLTQRALLAIGRSLAAEPETAGVLAMDAGSILTALRPGWAGFPMFLEPRDLLGREPRSAADFYVVGRSLARITEIGRASLTIGIGDFAEHAMYLEASNRPAHDPPTRWMQVEGSRLVLRDLAARVGEGRYLKTAQILLPRMMEAAAGLPEEGVWKTLRLAARRDTTWAAAYCVRAWLAGERPGPTKELRDSVLAWLDAHPALFEGLNHGHSGRSLLADLHLFPDDLHRFRVLGVAEGQTSP
jgi:hypothetical protein